MTVELDNLDDWRPLAGSLVLRAANERVRRVRVYLNCMEATPFYVVQTDMDDNGLPVKRPARFLTTMPAGLEYLEFHAAGDVEIAADDLERCVYWQATEDDRMVFDGDGESFTTIHDRAPRNEALEWVQYQAEVNQKRMQAALRAEMEEQLAAMREEYGRHSGVHGGPPAEHSKSEKPAAGNGKTGRKSGSILPAGQSAEGSSPADGSDDGEAEE